MITHRQPDDPGILYPEEQDEHFTAYSPDEIPTQGCAYAALALVIGLLHVAVVLAGVAWMMRRAG